MTEKVKPIKRIHVGRIFGEDDYRDIYPDGYCQRDGYKLEKREDGMWWCPNCGKLTKGGEAGSEE